MPRNLSNALDAVVLGDVQVREWQFWIYDIVSTKSDTTPTTINDVVRGAASTLRRDFADNILSVSITERGSDTLTGALGGASITFELADPDLIYDPVDGTTKRWLKPGNVVQLVEGYTGVPEAEWQTTFTGTIVGRAGRTNMLRNTGGVLSLSAEDRLAAFVKYTSTSPTFVQGVTYNFMMQEILTLKMGLDPTEYDLAGVGLATFTSQLTTQFVDESPIVSVSRILFTQGFVLRFKGDGTLGVVQLTVDKGSSRTYVDDDFFEDLSRPQDPQVSPNKVEVKGLAADMTRVFQTPGAVAFAGITQGFFSGDSSIKVKFSDDGTIFVDNPKLRILQSITGSLIPFGSEETLTVVVEDTDASEPSLAGSTQARIEVDGAFYAPLVVTLHAGRIAASFIPDGWAGIGGGSTIPIGRLVEGVIAISIALIQATIGTGDYEIIGRPYEYTFLELRGIAEVKDVRTVDVRPETIENHLLDSQVLVDAVALRELRLVRKRANEMQITMRHDLRLEPDDKFSRGANRSYIIASIQRTIQRGQASTASVTAFETTAGINP